jgi:hypothetical protein
MQQQAVELGLFTEQQVEQQHLDISQAASASLQNLLLQADKGRSFMDWEIIIIIIIPCKPYLSASATAPHPLGRRKVERLFSLFSV